MPTVARRCSSIKWCCSTPTANIYLHSFDKMFMQSNLSGTLVHYADDLVIAVWGGGCHVRTCIEQMLSRLKLTLNTEKTRLVKAEDGFDFLGEHFRLRPIKDPKTRFDQHCRLWPSDRSMERIRDKVRKTIEGKAVMVELGTRRPYRKGACRKPST